MGTRKPIDIPYKSAIQPIAGGKTAPPTTAITIKEEAFLVLGPKSFIPKAKMVGNMMDMKKNTSYRAMSDTQPRLALTTGSKRQQSA